MPDEDVMGFLSRVAWRNHLKGREEILLHVTGSANRIVAATDLAKLADYCRLTPQEIRLLSGVTRRGFAGEVQTYVCGEWVEKHAFVAPRQVKICPECLREDCYVRGMWALTLYTACPLYRQNLVTHCPNCRRKLKWCRKDVSRCGCGYDLSYAIGSAASGMPMQFATLLHSHLGESESAGYPEIDDEALEILSNLSLNGMLKVIWFLGHCVADMRNCHKSHGHAQPDVDKANKIIEQGLRLVSDWPRNLHKELVRLTGHCVPDNSASLLDRMLGPAQYYLREELLDEEFFILTNSYQRIVADIWNGVGHSCPSLMFGRQLSLDLN